MVVQVIEPGMRAAQRNGGPPPEHPVLELVGGVQRLRTAPPAEDAPELSPDETMRALRLLAVDSLLDVVNLRETVAAQQERITVLERELLQWQQRARMESDTRRTESVAAHRRERDLISVVHHQMLTTQAMSDELDRKRRRIWRRRRFRRS